MAAHCLLDFGRDKSQADTIIIRESTPYQAQYAVRRHFVHPNFQDPLLYSDIAIAELCKKLTIYYVYMHV